MIYDIAQTQVAEQGLPTKAIGRWFPYVATLLLFILVVNMLGFIPLPLSDEKFTLFGVELPTWGIYAATSSLSVTLALALMTSSSRTSRASARTALVGYFKSWIPDVPEGAVPADRPARDPRPVHAADLAERPSLREHARRPHADPHLHRADLRARDASCSRRSSIPVATAFYLFEVVIVVCIQAFIFAALSAIYIGSAIEPEH